VKGKNSAAHFKRIIATRTTAYIQVGIIIEIPNQIKGRDFKW
jgi:hypothetical protein